MNFRKTLCFLLVIACFLVGYISLKKEHLLQYSLLRLQHDTSPSSRCERYELSALELIAFCDLRAPFAVWLWLEAFTAWENQDWDRMLFLIKRVILLEPHQPLYYQMGAWYLAWNVKANAPSEVYGQQARFLLEEGIRCNPQSSFLYEQLGVLLRDKFHDHWGASRAFATAATLPGAHSYLRRFAAYELAECSEHEAEAYAQLQQLFSEGAAERTPALLAKMRLLEKSSALKITNGH